MRQIDFVFIFKLAFGAILIFFIYLLCLITAQYFPIRYDVAFLAVKEEQIKFLYYKIAFFAHIYTSWLVIILGFFQFWKYLRLRYSVIHRLFGKIYIFVVLGISAPSGLVMSFVANGGFIAQLSFVILSILWILFTYKAYHFAKNKNWKCHEQFMVYSYALTLSAISLRLLKYIIANTLELPPMDIYRIVSWGGWILNLILAEIYIRKSIK